MRRCLPASAAPTATCPPRFVSVLRSPRFVVVCSSLCFNTCSNEDVTPTQAAWLVLPSQVPSWSTMPPRIRPLTCANSLAQAPPCFTQAPAPPLPGRPLASSCSTPAGPKPGAWPNASPNYVECPDSGCQVHPRRCLVCERAKLQSTCPRRNRRLRSCVS